MLQPKAVGGAYKQPRGDGTKADPAGLQEKAEGSDPDASKAVGMILDRDGPPGTLFAKMLPVPLRDILFQVW